MAYEKNLTKKSEDLSDWYNRIVLEAELADYGPAKGTMIFRPYGYAIWELAQEALNREIKNLGVENAYFPLFIPMSFLQKEKKHVAGFYPELAVVTIGGGEELKEPLVVRPTSETIMYEAYSRWISSWRDLPIKINQWNNVVRWEKRTYLFLRTTEFLWQEGHTAHSDHEEALKMVHDAMNVYAKIYREYFALPGYVGRKSEYDKFAGADMTLSYESLMPEGKALQSCTSHDLGQNFAQVFNIKFQSQLGEKEYVWQTSWGFSTRSIGGLIMMHGDDKGLRLPPRLAPYQVIILPVRNDQEVILYTQEISEKLKNQEVRVKVDDRQDQSLGFRINKWEVKGVPLRIEVGQKELAEKMVTLIRRDNGDKIQIKLELLVHEVKHLLGSIQDAMYAEAQSFLAENTKEAENFTDFKNIMAKNRGFIKAYWCEDEDCEKKIKEETKASTRCLQEGEEEIKGEGICINCGNKALHRWLFGQAY